HTRVSRDWSSAVCSSDLATAATSPATASGQSDNRAKNQYGEPPGSFVFRMVHCAELLFLLRSRHGSRRFQRLPTPADVNHVSGRSEERRVATECRHSWYA